MIGTFGPVVFEASSAVLRTFSDFQRSGSSNIASHSVVGKKPAKEFIGPGGEEIGFKMRFSAFQGVKPKEQIDALRDMRDNGTVGTLVLDGKPVGKFMLASLSEDWTTIDNRGALVSAAVDVKLTEYR